MFMDIAAAKEVLSDKDKRNIFDSGDDPLDPEVRPSRIFSNPRPVSCSAMGTVVFDQFCFPHACSNELG